MNGAASRRLEVRHAVHLDARHVDRALRSLVEAVKRVIDHSPFKVDRKAFTPIRRHIAAPSAEDDAVLEVQRLPPFIRRRPPNPANAKIKSREVQVVIAITTARDIDRIGIDRRPAAQHDVRSVEIDVSGSSTNIVSRIDRAPNSVIAVNCKAKRAIVMRS